jgi:hypothetical protein
VAIGDRATATSDTGASASTTLTFAHSVAGASDLAIWVAVDDWRNPTGAVPTGVTYAAAALSDLGVAYLGGTGNDNRVSLWRKTAPATGANNVVVTLAQAHDIVAMSISYSGVDQTTPNDAVDVNDVTTQNVSNAVSSEVGDMVVDFAMKWGASAVSETGDGTLQLSNDNAGNAPNSMFVADAAGAATVTMSWNLGAGNDIHGQMTFNVNQATGGPGPAPAARAPARTLTGAGV